MLTRGDFVLHGGDTAFANRQKLLFDKLTDAEQECNRNKMDAESTDVNVNNESNKPQIILPSGHKCKIETRRFRGRESIFKRPEGPAPRALNRNIPDFRRNPHKWRKYSLDDVSNNDMTEQSNTRAALSFLKELKARRLVHNVDESEGMNIDEPGSVEQKSKKIGFKAKKLHTASNVEFRKPETEIDEMNDVQVIIEHNDKPIFRSSKIIMPEYVVGQKQKKKNKKEKSTIKVDRSKQLKLDHLNEPDEEDN